MNVDDLVAERIAEARRRIEANKRRRAALAAARQRGLAFRHAQKLRNLAAAADPLEGVCTCTYGARCANCPPEEENH